ncbi:MAG: hypothetical protein IKY94_11525 [Lachnospiraceae bacterium]|nr:hypothetical protein [Lachnospiraceae bacterium]
MLMDKSGLRKGKKPQDTPSKKNKKKSNLTNREKAINLALNTGIGYSQYKKEVDAINAARIRKNIEKSGTIIKEDNI